MQPIAEVLSSKRIEDSSGLRLCLSLMNEIRRQPRETVWAQISKAQGDAARGAMDSEFFRQPVVRSGGVAHRLAAPTQPTPFLAAESLAAPASPSPTKDVFWIDDNTRNTN